MPCLEAQQHVVLIRHEDTAAPGVLEVSATASRSDGVLALGFLVEGDIDTLIAPVPGPIVRGRYLWQHTCFEAFIRVRGSKSYHELNFAPSCEWDAYAFTRYREGALVKGDAMKPELRVRRDDGVLRLDARIALSALAPEYLSDPLSIGLSAVLESRQGALTYWALRHAPGKPDFHHDRAFALDLA